MILDYQVLTATTALIGGYNEGLPIQMPLVDVFEVGTGGGSIASLDVGNALRVGPRSAGAEPGPACYGRGGTAPTVTDANVVLGRLSPERFLGGEMMLDTDAAARAVTDNIAKPLGLSAVRAAEGILDIAITKMSYAVKGVSTERGLDAASFTMVAYGGAGPLHACAIAREIGIARVIIPHAPGHFCAFGMLHSDLRYDNVRTWLKELDKVSFEDINAIFKSLESQGRRSLEDSAITPERVAVSFAADMRYVGQEHPVTVEFTDSLIETADRSNLKHAFDIVHKQRYGTSAPNEPAEIVSLRASVTGQLQKPALERRPPGATSPKQAFRTEREVYFGQDHGLLKTPIYVRDKLKPRNRVAGPALVEEHASTTVVLPGDKLEVDSLGNLDIRIGGNL